MGSKAVHQTLAAFVAERDWAQFHTPENLAKSIAIEAGELLECFQSPILGEEPEDNVDILDFILEAFLLFRSAVHLAEENVELLGGSKRDMDETNDGSGICDGRERICHALRPLLSRRDVERKANNITVRVIP